MKLYVMSFDHDGDDEEALPETITVEMTRAEFVAIARLFGAMNGHAMRRLGLDEGIYGCLVGDVINRYWEGGLDDLAPRIELAELNEPIE